jgi:hypothetical protein
LACGKVKKKYFFFEKKKQKTFALGFSTENLGVGVNLMFIAVADNT